MEMAANVRSMRVICSPEREEDVAEARELLHPPQSPISLLSHCRGRGMLSRHVLVTFPSTLGSPALTPVLRGLPCRRGRAHVHTSQYLPNLPGGASELALCEPPSPRKSRWLCPSC